MSKYLEFKQVPFKGKTKRFEVISKSSIGVCEKCCGKGWYINTNSEIVVDCSDCNRTGRTDIILGRISWYSQWRCYTFSPAFETIWNKDCLKDIHDFLQQLKNERKFTGMKPDSITYDETEYEPDKNE